eukprot:5366792-Prymnesium_polylepis.1
MEALEQVQRCEPAGIAERREVRVDVGQRVAILLHPLVEQPEVDHDAIAPRGFLDEHRDCVVRAA